MLLSLLSEFWPRHARKSHHGTTPTPVAAPPRAPTAIPVAIPVDEMVVHLPLPAGVRRLGSVSHLRALTPQEILLFLLGQLSALMDSKDGPDWTINPAYHPDVHAFIAKHANNTLFVAKARALQKNRAPFYGKTVVAGPRRKTILSVGRTTVIN